MNTLTPLFDWLLAASLRASLLTVVVLAVQATLRHRMPARWRYALWLPVLVVLLMPVFPASQWSVGSIIHAAPAQVPQRFVIESSTGLPALSPAVAAQESPAQIPWHQVLVFAWLIGAAGLVLCGLGFFAQSLCRFRNNRLPVSEGLLYELSVVAREVGLRRVPHVWMSPAIRSPAVMGLLRPTLLLPAQFEEMLAPQEARLVLQHELTHIKRGDLPLNALLCLLMALHWFNPLLWLAFFRARLDREVACDAQVLDSANQTQRVAYGHTLLKIETAFSHHGLSLGFVGIFQRGAALRFRIQSIATQSNPAPLIKAVLGLGIVLLTFLGITKAAAPDANAPQIVIWTKFVQVSGPRNELPVIPAPLDTAKKVPGPVGIFTDPQFQVLIRELSQRKGVDLMSAPQVITKAGQQATIEVVREFAYKDEAGKPATKNTGITFAVLPKVTADGHLDLDLTPQIVEFEDYVKRKSGWKEPIFTTREAIEHVVLASGQTFVLEMASKKDKQTVQELDEAERVVSSRIDTFTRRTFVFVTAQLIDPAKGKRRDAKKAGP